MAARKKTDVSTHVEEFQALFTTIERSQWTIGKRLTELQYGDSEMTSLGQQLRPVVGLSSLKRYETVYRTFKDQFPDGPKDFAWGVLNQLARVTSDHAVEWRAQFLKEHPKATVSLAARKVNEKIREDRDGGRGPRFKATGSLVLAGEGVQHKVNVEGLLKKDGLGSLEISGLDSAQLVGPDDYGIIRLSFRALDTDAVL
jgi:hypothetical protein